MMGHWNIKNDFGLLVRWFSKGDEFPPSDEPLVEEISRRSEDKGFFRDVVEWLRSESPSRLKRLLADLWLADRVPYERLCRAVASTEFRASRSIERRMARGPSNEWVQKYFEDFCRR